MADAYATAQPTADEATDPASEERGRRSSIERVLLAGLAERNLSVNRLTLEVTLMNTESGREKLFSELKKELRNREQIINSIREAYLRDVIAVKDQLVRDAAEREEFQRQLQEPKEPKETTRKPQQQLLPTATAMLPQNAKLQPATRVVSTRTQQQLLAVSPSRHLPQRSPRSTSVAPPLLHSP